MLHGIGKFERGIGATAHMLSGIGFPFATIFAPYVRAEHAKSGAMLIELIIFVAALLLAYIYAWGKGVFRWD